MKKNQTPMHLLRHHFINLTNNINHLDYTFFELDFRSQKNRFYKSDLVNQINHDFRRIYRFHDFSEVAVSFEFDYLNSKKSNYLTEQFLSVSIFDKSLTAGHHLYSKSFTMAEAKDMMRNLNASIHGAKVSEDRFLDVLISFICPNHIDYQYAQEQLTEIVKTSNFSLHQKYINDWNQLEELEQKIKEDKKKLLLYSESLEEKSEIISLKKKIDELEKQTVKKISEKRQFLLIDDNEAKTFKLDNDIEDGINNLIQKINEVNNEKFKIPLYKLKNVFNSVLGELF